LITVKYCNLVTVEFYHLITVTDDNLIVVKIYLYYLIRIQIEISYIVNIIKRNKIKM